MTISDQTPLRLLPMSDHVRGKRSAVTCQLKCANACLGPECNTSDEPALPGHRLFGPLPTVPARPGPRRRPRPRGRQRRRRRWHRRRVRCPARHRGPRVRPDRPREPPGRRVHGSGRIPVAADHPLGRPAVLVDAGARLRPPDRRGAGRPVRLQQRLPRHHRRSERQDRRARQQPRVREPEHHVPRDDRSRRAPAPRRHLQGGPGHVGRRTAAPQGRRAVVVRRRRHAQSPHHGRDGVRAHGPRGRLRPREDRRRPRGALGQGHAGQLRRRHHAVGHGAVGRGELQRLLRLGRRHGRAEALQRHVDDLDGDRLGGLRPPLRCAQRRLRERAEPVRLHRGDRPERPDRRRR